jgi:hypothetical protein
MIETRTVRWFIEFEYFTTGWTRHASASSEEATLAALAEFREADPDRAQRYRAVRVTYLETILDA